MLYEEAFLFASFNVMINDSFADLCNYTADGHTQEAQTELIASFEDLLKRQNRLYKSFNLLLNDEPTLDNDVMIDFLAAYENLLRIEANLYMSFYNLLNMKYEGQGPCNETIPTPPGCVPPTITVERIEMNPGQKFVINVTNNDAVSLNVNTLNGTGGLVNSTGATYSITDTNWTLAGNVGTYNNLPASIGPGATQTFVLDKLLIGGTVILPDDLVFTFCATTDCGTVCMTDIDNIQFLAPLPP